MMRVRFHGRGGQGAKTAARILGTAAFLEGFTAQDSPIYGAERRGAPVAAYARFSRGPIRERGLIVEPDLVVVADETLLQDPASRVLEGTTPETALFVNSALAPEQLEADRQLPKQTIALDLTGLGLARLGKTPSLSALLGAVAARLAGLQLQHVREAVVRELTSLGLSEPTVQENVKLASECYEKVPTISAREPRPAAPEVATLRPPVYEPPTRGTARIAAVANAPLRKTGDWRVFRPVVNLKKCNGCTLCFVYCPEAAITLTDKNRPIIDYDHCKGCGLCITECPTHAITAERETAGEHR